MNLIDTHAHLDDSRFDKDREKVIKRTFEDGIKLVINIGCDLMTSKTSVEFAEKYKQIYAAIGVHPHDAGRTLPYYMVEEFERILKHPKVVAIGEIGLDYYYDHSPRSVQKEIFLEQLNLAKRARLPVIIHVREAFGDFLEIMRREGLEPIKGVMHCYSGSLEVAYECIEMGFYISFAGPVTFKNAKNLKEVAKKLPLDRILIETDCPYLSPEPNRGKRNEPLYVKYVAEEIANLKDISLEKVANATYKNALDLFYKIEQNLCRSS